jgi:hypothetical protein
MQTIRRKRLVKEGSDTIRVIYDLFLANEHLVRSSGQRKEEAGERGIWADVYHAWRQVQLAIEFRKKKRREGNEHLSDFWPHFDTPYFGEWISDYTSPAQARLPRFSWEVIDEMSRIVEDIERSPTGAFLEARA